MKIVVVGCYQRRAQAEALALRMRGHLVMDEIGQGALWGHRKALAWAALQAARTVIMEDDALPVDGFRDRAAEWLDRFPDDLWSGYLGTGRPPQFQTVIRSEIAAADARGCDHIRLRQLIHGVCYSLPQHHVAAVYSGINARQAADFAIGNAWRAVAGRDVVYPVASLVEHGDGPSIERHPDGEPRTEKRRAWRLAAEVTA